MPNLKCATLLLIALLGCKTPPAEEPAPEFTTSNGVRGAELERLILSERSSPVERWTNPQREPGGSVSNIGDLAVEPKIDGRVIGLRPRTGIVFISAGSESGLWRGAKFTVMRGDLYVSVLVADHIEPGWSGCHEETDWRKPENNGPQLDDEVTTRLDE